MKAGSRLSSAQAELTGLPSAEELFPQRHRSFAEYAMAKIRAALAGDQRASPAAQEWEVGFNSRDRVYLCQLAGLESASSVLSWAGMNEAARARLLAAFERRHLWYRQHAAFSIGTNTEEFAAELRRRHEKERARLQVLARP